MTNLILLSISITTNQPMFSYIGPVIGTNESGQQIMKLERDPITYTTNYHFGIIQGTNQIQLLTLQQK